MATAAITPSTSFDNFSSNDSLLSLTFHRNVSWTILLLSPVVAITLLYFQPTTYGKLDGRTNTTKRKISNIVNKRHWLGPLLPSHSSWMIFESPCWIWVVFVITLQESSLKKDQDTDDSTLPLPNKILLFWFFIHYIYRSIVYPVQMMLIVSDKHSQMPFGICVCAFSYVFVNGYLQSHSLYHYQTFPDQYEHTIQFRLGITVTVFGFYIAYTSDQTLLRLKNQKQQRRRSKYQIPYGGLFTYISCPHYFGEIMEWIGFCIANNYSLASLSFVLWTMANLIPRAYNTHVWYQSIFGNEYQELNRNIIIPLVF